MGLAWEVSCGLGSVLILRNAQWEGLDNQKKSWNSFVISRYMKKKEEEVSLNQKKSVT